MKHYALLISLCSTLVFLLFWRSPLCTHETPGKTKSKPNSIEGLWTEIIWDREGGIHSMLPDLLPPRMGQWGIPCYYIWKITKETIEHGPDIKDRFPRWRYTYELNPGNQEGAIALLPLVEDKNKKKMDKPKKQLAIYFVKGDYLMICFGQNVRPKSFTTSKDNPTTIYILHRGKMQFADSDSAKPKRKDK